MTDPEIPDDPPTTPATPRAKRVSDSPTAYSFTGAVAGHFPEVPFAKLPRYPAPPPEPRPFSQTPREPPAPKPRAAKRPCTPGETYNGLTSVEPRPDEGENVWLFRCVCGNEKLSRFSNVRAGMVKSCGCLRQVDRAEPNAPAQPAHDAAEWRRRFALPLKPPGR